MDDSGALTRLLWEWGFILVPLLYIVMRRPSSGLVASYCFQMWMLYWLGAVIHAFPWAELPDTEYVVHGFQQATWGMAAFAVGVIVVAPGFARGIMGNSVPRNIPDGSQAEMDPAKARRYIMMGLISYFLLRPTLGRVTGLQAVPAAASQLVVTGCCLQSWMAWHKDGKAGLLRTLPQTLMIPMVTVVGLGFMSYGVLALSTIMLFVGQFFRPRWILGVGGLIAAYMGLTVYVSYMRDRDEIRSASGALYYFSTESQVAVVEFPGMEHPVFCGRCRQRLEPGSSCVCCPACSIWFHQGSDLPCWTYSEKCPFCSRATSLDTGFAWIPED